MNLDDLFSNINAVTDVGVSPQTNMFSDLNLKQQKTTNTFDSNVISQQKYNELYHDVELYLDNSGTFDASEKTRYHINPAAVLNLTIIDSFANWVNEGSMTFLYLPDEAPPSSYGGQTSNAQLKAAKQNASLLKAYQFRGDGFDLLKIKIVPSTQKESPLNTSLNINPNDPNWILTFLFSVYDIEDLGEVPDIEGLPSTYLKCFKLYFRDIRHHLLNTVNLQYSTALSKRYRPNFFSGLANEGVLKVGDAMLDVYNSAIEKFGLGATLEFGYPSKSSSKWDKGGNSIFYTSPATFSALEDLEYLYAHHVSATFIENTKINDFCVLHTERNKTPGLFDELCLTPLSEFFSKAGSSSPGELQLEHFFVTTFATEKSTISNSYKAPIAQGDKVDLKTTKYGQILSYSFVDMSPEMNNNLFITTPVCSVDIANRVFSTQFTNNTVQAAKKVISNSYISKLMHRGGNPEKLFLPTLHSTKKSINVFPTFSLNGDSKITRQRNGIHQLIYTGLFQNAGICFTVLGLTLRQAGTFIAIDRLRGSKDSDYNNKLYGQWFVLKVEHAFEGGNYINRIYAVKTHRYKELSIKFPETI